MKKRLISVLLTAVLLLGLCPAAGAAYTEMAFSDALVAYIKQGEGFSPKAFSDGTGWYIGYGCMIDPADYPNGISEPEAEALLRSYMQRFADYANQSFLKKYGVTVTQSQFDAICAMSYALGPGWLKAGNRLPDYLISGIDNYTDQQIGTAFAAWCHVGSSVNTVALKRRIMETKMFLYGDYTFSADGWSWLILNAAGGRHAFSDVAIFPTGKPYGTLPEATRDGWYFAGWVTRDGRVLSPTDTVSENLNVTAQWSAAPLPQPEAPVLPEGAFSDIPADAWYADDVTALADAGVINGFRDGSFRPEASVTWGQALKLFLLSAGYPEQTPEAPKEGEPAPHWASAYLRYAEKKSFVAEDAAIDLDAPITRNDMADLCAAALELTEAAQPSPFDDSDRDSVLKLYAAELMIGSVNSSGQRLFKGGDNISRAEICAVLVRVMDYVDRTLILFAGYRIPVDYSLRMNTRDNTNFYDKNGRIYYDDGVTTVRYGIDVSTYQGDVDWAAVASDGIDFAIIRCGYRGYGQGTLNEDPYFRKNVTEALANGLDVGIYFFSQALSAEEAREEADYALELIQGYDIRFPVVFDWEIVPNAGSRTRGYEKKDVADFIEVFCEAVAAEGYTPMAYYNPSLAYLHLDLAKAQKYDGWLAHYVSRTNYRYDYQMWQYGSSGSVKGINGRCDMDIAFVDFAKK